MCMYAVCVCVYCDVIVCFMLRCMYYVMSVSPPSPLWLNIYCFDVSPHVFMYKLFLLMTIMSMYVCVRTYLCTMYVCAMYVYVCAMC